MSRLISLGCSLCADPKHYMDLFQGEQPVILAGIRVGTEKVALSRVQNL